jgi:GH43 family beta-xylosidase
VEGERACRRRAAGLCVWNQLVDQMRTGRWQRASLGVAWLLFGGVSPALSTTYQNPLVRNVADPFVLKHRGEYYLYRTEVRGALDVLTSRDLMHWRQGPVVWRPTSPQAENGHHIWAPEVYYENGRFILLFSASGQNDNKRLWRAVSNSPLGPFRLSPDQPLTAPWRIDASLFRDDDGARYLYSCHRRPLASGALGAQVEGVRLQDGQPVLGDWLPMVVPEAPWEGIWVEGPTVLKDRSRYFLLYSAPDAESPNYQVGYATAAHPLGPWKKRGILIPSLPTVPGPGHQSVVLAPDNLTPYLVYHRKRLAERGWNRDLMLDRLCMRDGTLLTRAPSMVPQPAPPRAAFEERFDRPDWQRSWTLRSGDWRVDTTARDFIQVDAQAQGRASLKGTRLGDGVVEVNLRRLGGVGGIGLALVGRERLPILLSPEGRRGLSVGGTLLGKLPEEPNPAAYHQLLVTRRGAAVEVRLDGSRIAQASVPPGPVSLELVTQRSAAAFSAVAVTDYVDARPLPPVLPLSSSWHRFSDRIEQRSLGLGVQRYETARLIPTEGEASVRMQGWALGTSLGVSKYGVHLESTSGKERFEAYIDPGNGVLATHGITGGRELPWENSDLPLRFDYTSPHTLRVTRRGADWQVTVNGESMQFRGARISGAARLVLITEDARVTFSQIRIKSARAAVRSKVPRQMARGLA